MPHHTECQTQRMSWRNRRPRTKQWASWYVVVRLHGNWTAANYFLDLPLRAKLPSISSHLPVHHPRPVRNHPLTAIPTLHKRHVLQTRNHRLPRAHAPHSAQLHPLRLRLRRIQCANVSDCGPSIASPLTRRSRCGLGCSGVLVFQHDLGRSRWLRQAKGL